MNRLKELRLENGYKTQQDLAAVLFVNQTAVSQWERGVTIPTGQTLIKLSKMYGVSIDYLLGISSERFSPDGGQREKSSTTDMSKHDCNIVKIAGRDGSMYEWTVSDSQRDLIKQMLENLKPVDDEDV